jgi:hypothetical protein
MAGGSAASQPLFYVENNVGRSFCAAFNAFADVHGWGAVFQNDIHQSMQRAQHGDEWWLRDIGSLDYALLTCDMKITRVQSERQVVIDSGLRFVGFANANYDGWVQLGAVARHWNSLATELAVPGPVIVKLYSGSTPPEVERP